MKYLDSFFLANTYARQSDEHFDEYKLRPQAAEGGQTTILLNELQHNWRLDWNCLVSFSPTHLLTIQAGWGLLSIPCISKFSVCISCCYHSWQRNSWFYLNVALPFRAFTVVLNCKWRKCSNYSYRCSSWRPDLYNLTECIWIWTHLSVLVLHKCIHGRTSSDLSQSNGEKNLSHGCFAAAELHNPF